MSQNIHEQYVALRGDAERMASAFAALVLLAQRDCAIAVDVAKVFEEFACRVLDQHPVESSREAEGGHHDAA